MRHDKLATLLFVTLLLTGCSKVPAPPVQCISPLVKQRSNQDFYWRQSVRAHDAITSQIQKLLQNELTPDSAAQIALLKNPKVQAICEELGISHADLIEAGLLSNPIFNFTSRFPNQTGYRTDIQYSITASFLDIFLVPLRKKIAAAQFEKTKFKVTHAILDLGFDVQETYYELQAVCSRIKYMTDIAELSNIQEEIAKQQILKGNIYRINFESFQDTTLDSELVVAEMRAEVIHLKKKLSQLLGLCEDTPLIMPVTPPTTDYIEFSLPCLEQTAIKERLDIWAARWEVIRLSRMLGVKQWWVYTEGRLGVSSEVEPEGFTIFGPAISGAIPIFNGGQADRLRLSAQLRQAQEYLATLEIEALAEVREAHKALMNYLEMIHQYQDKLLLLENKILTSAESLYNVMGIGIDRLLEYKKHQLQIYSDYILTLSHYWMARVRLDRALGGKLYMLLPHTTAKRM